MTIDVARKENVDTISLMSNTVTETMVASADMTIGEKAWRPSMLGFYRTKQLAEKAMGWELKRCGERARPMRIATNGREWYIEAYRPTQTHRCGREVGLGHSRCWFCHCG